MKEFNDYISDKTDRSYKYDVLNNTCINYRKICEDYKLLFHEIINTMNEMAPLSRQYRSYDLIEIGYYIRRRPPFSDPIENTIKCIIRLRDDIIPNIVVRKREIVSRIIDSLAELKIIDTKVILNLYAYNEDNTFFISYINGNDIKIYSINKYWLYGMNRIDGIVNEHKTKNPSYYLEKINYRNLDFVIKKLQDKIQEIENVIEYNKIVLEKIKSFIYMSRIDKI
jgi:hypothetical protein